MSGGGWQRPSSLKSVTHILQQWNLANLKKILKIYNLCDKPLELCWHQPEISNFFWVFKDCLINMVFWKKYFEIKVTASYFLSITARHDSNYILGMVMRPNFGNVAFLWGKLSKPRFCKDLIRKSNFLGVLLVQVQ